MKSELKQTDTATFTINGKTAELPVFKAAHGPDVVDIRALYKQTSAFTFDPGFTSTASCESKITFIDGDKGILLYRGFPIPIFYLYTYLEYNF